MTTDNTDNFDLPPCRPESGFVRKPDALYREEAISIMIKDQVERMHAAAETAHYAQLAQFAARAGVSNPDIPSRVGPNGSYIQSPSEAHESNVAATEARLVRELEHAQAMDADTADQEHSRKTGYRLDKSQIAALPVGPRVQAVQAKLDQLRSARERRLALKAAYEQLPELPRAEALAALDAWEAARKLAKAQAERAEAVRRAKREAEAAAERLASLESIEVSP